MKFGVFGQRFDGFCKCGTRCGANDELPGVAEGSAFVKRWGGSRNNKFVFERRFEQIIVRFGVFDGGGFCFVSDAKTSEVIKRRKMTRFAFGQDVMIESVVIIVDDSVDDGMIWLISLNKNFGGVEMSAADATNNLGEKMKGSFF